MSPEMNQIRETLLNLCHQYLNENERQLRESIADLQRSANEETKSSAGDKYETGRAMAQLEIEKLSAQANEIIKQRNTLLSIKSDRSSEIISIGAVVETSIASYFLGISGPKFLVDGKTFFCISVSSPIGAALKGKTVGEIFSFNGKQHKILKVY